MSFGDALLKSGLVKKDLIGWREAVTPLGEGKCSGYLFLAKNRLVFVRKGGFMAESKVMFDTPVKKILNIIRMPGMVIIQWDASEKDSNFFKKLFSTRGTRISMDKADEFVAEIKKLNPKIG